MHPIDTEADVILNEVEPGVAVVTISIFGEDHMFDLWVDGDTAKVSYEETLSFRGNIRASQPDPDVYVELMISDKVTEFLDENGCESLKRADMHH